MIKRLFMSVALVLVIIMILVGCKPVDIGDGDLAKLMAQYVDEEKVANFSDYQKEPNLSIKGNDYTTIDFEGWKNSDPVKIVTTALANSLSAKQQASIIMTNSYIRSNKNGTLKELQRVLQRSSVVNATNGGDSYNQIASAALEIITDNSLINGVIDQLKKDFGVANRSVTINGTTQNNGGSKPVFALPDEAVVSPAGVNVSWDKSWKNASISSVDMMLINDINGGELSLMADDPADLLTFKKGKYTYGDSYVIDPITGEKASYISTVNPFDGGKKGYTGAIYINGNHHSERNGTLSQYDMGYNVIDKNKSQVTKKGNLWTVKLVYQKGESDNSEFYASKIDQACRVAAGMLINDTNGTPMKMGRIEYQELEMTYQIWDNGFVKRMDRREKFSSYISFSVVVKSGEGLGFSQNSAYQIWSYSDRDTDIRALSGK